MTFRLGRLRPTCFTMISSVEKCWPDLSECPASLQELRARKESSLRRRGSRISRVQALRRYRALGAARQRPSSGHLCSHLLIEFWICTNKARVFSRRKLLIPKRTTWRLSIWRRLWLNNKIPNHLPRNLLTNASQPWEWSTLHRNRLFQLSETRRRSLLKRERRFSRIWLQGETRRA